MAAGRSFALSVVIEAIDKITGPLRRIGGALGAAGEKVAAVGEKLRALGDRAGLPILTAALGKVGDAVGGIGKRLALVGGGIAAFGLAGAAALVPLIQSYADTTGAIGDLAAVTGASRERIQELGYAAQLSGSSAETLGGALTKMNLVIGEATKGSKDLKEMFAGLQINLKNSNGTLKSTDELFDLFVNRISRIKDPALQAQAAVKIFGKSATELLPLLRSGNKGIAEMAAEARSLGVVIANDAVESGEELGDVMDKISLALKGAGNAIAGALVPSLNKLGATLVDAIIKYRPQLEAFAATFAENLPGYIDKTTEAFRSIGEAVGPVISGIGKMFEMFGAGPTLVGTLGAALGATLLAPIITLTTAVWGLGAAILATPVGWILAAIAAIAAAVYLIYNNWDEFSSFFTDKFQAVKDAFKDNFVLGLVQVWKEFNPVSLIMDALNGLIKFATGIDVGSIIKEKLGMGGGEAGAPSGNPEYTAVPEGGPIAAGLADAKAKITVDFKNLPNGADVDTSSGQGVKLQTNQGYSMMAAR